MNVFTVLDRLYGGGAIAVEPALCLHTRSNRSGCQACAEACPARALAPGSDGPALDAALCRGCGLCAPACPTGVFTLREAENLLPKLGEGRMALITCAIGPDREAVRVPCLASLSPETLAAAAASRSLLLCAPDACADCTVGGAPRLTGLVAAAERILAAFGLSGTVQLVHGTTQSQHEVAKANQMDRRQFLSFARLGLVSAASAVVRPDPAPASRQELPARVSSGRRHLLTVLRRRAGAVPAAAPATSLPFGAVVLAGEGCNGCEACTRSCPSGALSLARGGERDHLIFAPDRCMACGLCVEACPSTLLSLSGTFNPAAVVAGETAELLELPVATCRRCHRSYYGTAGLCPECRKVDWMRSAVAQLR